MKNIIQETRKLDGNEHESMDMIGRDEALPTRIDGENLMTMPEKHF